MNRKITLTYIFISLITVYLQAIPAKPFPVTNILPDGNTFEYIQKGDEFFKYKTTTDGYLIIQQQDGFFYYADYIDNTGFKSRGIKANNPDKRSAIELNELRSMQAYPNFSKQHILSKISKVAETDTASLQKAYPKTGSPKSLVILVNFKDASFVTPDPVNAFSDMLNKSGYSDNNGTGSAKDYFYSSSNGISSPNFIVVGPYNLPNDIKYYGENGTDGNDKNPRQMVIDACSQAYSNGVNFKDYDTDNDGTVDNVFIYYAGYNEAENGPENTIWPHRWALNTSVTYNGVKISGYACSSELKSNSGSTMCGIGTFCHEFGHVYGLVDYYPTDGGSHHTLSFWNIMDAGAYLNGGRTPPTYAAYDRFFLGWLKPTELKTPQSISMNNLLSTNKAYLISATGNHNLIGNAPSPAEFFILENRQKTGWDRYLPYSGMMITRIKYDATKWYNNTPNNVVTAMAVDLMEADGIGSSGSLTGDLFPGSKNVTSFTPILMSGSILAKPITKIKETNGIISFDFMGGGNIPTIKMNSETLNQFITVHGTPSTIQTLTINGANLVGDVIVSFSNNIHFQMRKQGDISWSNSLTFTPVDSTLTSMNIELRYNPLQPSFDDIHLEYLVFNTKNIDAQQTELIGKSSRPVYVVPPLAKNASEVSMEKFIANWESVYDANGYYLTAYNIGDGTTFFRNSFDNGPVLPDDWTSKGLTLISNSAYAGDSIPSAQLSSSGDYIQTAAYLSAATEISFFVRSIAESNGTISILGWNGNTWVSIGNLNITSSLTGIQTYPLEESLNFTQFKLTYTRGTGYVALDDIQIKLNKLITFNASNKWVTTTSDTIYNIVPGRSYSYLVKASDKTLKSDNTILYENITAPSNLISFDIPFENVSRYIEKDGQIEVYKDGNKNILISLPQEMELNTQTKISIFNTLGQLVKQLPMNQHTHLVSGLKPGQIYFIQIGEKSLKIMVY